MRRKLCLLAALAVLLAVLLGGCGSSLPDGMDEDEVINAGLRVMKKMIDGDYDGVCGELREDVRAQTDAAAIETMMDSATEGLGSYKKVSDSMATGVEKKDSEPHAIAVIRAKYEQKSVIFRVAFDTDMNLIGLDVKRR